MSDLVIFSVMKHPYYRVTSAHELNKYMTNQEEEFKRQMKNQGYSKEAIEELWKWYDPSTKKGVASY
jgi:hypothetical protein